MEAVDTRYVKFGPDVGQLQKGGSDPVKVVKDFLPVVRHVHMKDFDGGEHYLGYCPLGQGKVDVAGAVRSARELGQRPDDHGGARSIAEDAGAGARGRTDQQGDAAEAGVFVPILNFVTPTYSEVTSLRFAPHEGTNTRSCKSIGFVPSCRRAVVGARQRGQP